MAAASVSPSAAAVPDADELRAAALRTLKSKRKRPEPTNALPQPVRPAVQRRDSATVALNYDDDSEPAQQGLPTPPPTATVEPPPPAGSVTDEDVDMAEREEGEISDAEEAAEGLPSTSAPKDSLLAVPSPSTNGVLPISLDRPGNAAMPPPALEASLLLPPSSPVLVRSSAAVPTPAERDLRPKLKIPPEELHEIKLHILDILGLGVPPEYFVDCGLDQDTIAYAFHELNLRLPYNINLNGQENVLYPKPIDERVRIPPKPSKPPPLQTSVPATPKASPSTPLTQRFPPPASGLPPKPSAAVLRADATRSSTIAQPARANAPPMATPVILASSSPASTSKPAATVSPSQPATPRPDLQEMESQKKQELKARKAVLDSLKSKKAAGAAAVNRIPLSATAPIPGIATTSQSVDVSSDPVADFLRSIPVEAAPTSTATVPPLAQSPDPMDVDPVQDFHDLRTTPPVQQPRPSISPPSANTQQDPQSSMRGVKRSRPVAADFNDEAGYASSSSLGSSDNGAPPVKRPAHRNNGKKTSTHVAHPPPAIRKYSSFAGLPNLWQSSHVIHSSPSKKT
ncbi:hypothetical protein EXIGLDRAFT_32878 [Exidia glandulosa HHB12029]|uniref:Uncharacterized protein n=1 Tax=Exidia glandulosa HHB12029 TaxID=1314781 RepID=A0A165ISE1_EXIGL|nr:hypothetical protein EXIGLDRAFT_32878 [Exidia glandulosa HHB12029]